MNKVYVVMHREGNSEKCRVRGAFSDKADAEEITTRDNDEAEFTQEHGEGCCEVTEWLVA